MTKKQVFITIVFIFLVFVSFGFWFFFIRDEPSVDDSDLYLLFQSTPRENNGYLRLSEVGAKVSFKTGEVDDVLSKQPFDVPTARQLVNLYSKELAEFYQVGNYPNFGRSNPNEHFLNSGLYQLPKLAQLQGKLALEEGKFHVAADIGVFLIQLGFRYEHCNGNILDCLFGMNMKRQGLDLIQNALEKGLVPSGKERIRNQIAPFGDSKEGFIESLRLEYSWGRDIIITPANLATKVESDDKADKLSLSQKMNQKLIQIAIRLPIFYKPHKTLRVYHNYFRESIAFQSGKRHTLPRSMKIQPSVFSGNGIGELLLTLITPDLNITKPIETERQFQKIIQTL